LPVTVDDRERASDLAGEVARRWRPTRVGRLPVGDVEIGSRVLVERKTVADFVISLEDGRLFRQAGALAQACERPLLVVEGEDPLDAARIDPEGLRGVLLTLLVGFRIPMLRTACVAETAESVARVARHETRRCGRRPHAEPTKSRQALDVLASIPGVGDERARRLLDEFGSVRGVATASEEDLQRVERVGRVLARAIARVLGGGAP
jgi:Fanconi anemia group M protein